MSLLDINRWARRTPAKTALVYNDRPVSYGAFARVLAATRQRLALERLPPGALVVVIGYNAFYAWSLVTAARSLGLTTLYVDTVQRAAELALNDVSALLFAETEAGDPSGRPASFYGGRLIAVPPAVLETAEGADATLAAADPAGEPGDHVLYTSGTTGAYKKVRQAGHLEAARNRVRAQAVEFTSGSVFHAMSFGLWTAVGFNLPAAAWQTGACVIIDQTPDKFANFFRYQPTYTQLLPETLRALVAAHPDRTASARLYVRCGGGFTPVDVAQQAVERLTPRLVSGFAATELTGLVATSQYRTAEEFPWLTVAEGRRLEIVDEAGDICPVGVDGEVRVELTELDNTAYMDDPEATARHFRDGFFYPGDMAVRRADGKIRIVGRVADVINVRGQKLALAPVEQRLQQGLGGAEVCLFLGLAPDGLEELVVAVCDERSALSTDAVLRNLDGLDLADRVRVEILPTFPRTATGKTRRVDLRRLVSAV